MPYKIAWHPDVSALVVHYKGSVPAEEYRQMVAERAELLEEASGDVSVVMDMRQLKNFPDALSVGEEENVLQRANVRQALLVVDGELYKKLATSLVPDTAQRWPVRFFVSVEDALGFAKQPSPQPEA